MIDILTFNCPILVSKFEAHEKIKLDLIDSIDKTFTDFSNLNGDEPPINISKTDWYTKSDQKREYFDVLLPHLTPHLNTVFDIIDYKEWNYSNIWFQKYGKNNEHSWHRHHKTMFNCIYYVELSNDGPQTMFRDPIYKDKTFNVNAKEGDIIIFPSMLLHCSPKNQSDFLKTIVAVNIE
jgi:hypothetical protein